MGTSELFYHILTQSIVLSYQGKQLIIANEDPRYEGIIKQITANDYGAVISSVFADLPAEFKIVGGKVVIDGETVPHDLSEKILYYQANSLPLESLTNFARKLQKNKDEHVRKALYGFLAMKSHPITPRGTFIAYKGVRKDFKDQRTGTFNNSPGELLEMDMDKVDNNPDRGCSSGFHAGTYEYARGFASVVVEVEIDPEDVGSVPHDCNAQKIRCAQYRVLRVCEEELSHPHYDPPKITKYGKRDVERLVKKRTKHGITQKALGALLKLSKHVMGKFERNELKEKDIELFSNYKANLEILIEEQPKDAPKKSTSVKRTTAKEITSYTKRDVDQLVRKRVFNSISQTDIALLINSSKSAIGRFERHQLKEKDLAYFNRYKANLETLISTKASHGS